MTILRPNKNYSMVRFLVAFFGIILVGGIIYIFEYNALVDSRSEIKKLKGDIVAYQTDIATLKNDLYSKIDPVGLRTLAVGEGLVVDKHPQYVTVQKP